MAKNIVLQGQSSPWCDDGVQQLHHAEDRCPGDFVPKFLEQVDRKNVASVTIYKDGRIDGVSDPWQPVRDRVAERPGLVGDCLASAWRYAPSRRSNRRSCGRS